MSAGKIRCPDFYEGGAAGGVTALINLKEEKAGYPDVPQFL